MAALALVVLAGGFVILSQLGVGRNGTAGVAEDSSVLAVVAGDLVNASKEDSGAADAIGGYLPGVGIVMTVHLDDLEVDQMEGWVAEHLNSFADRISMLPNGEAVVVTLDVKGPNQVARVWSLQPADIERTEGWERLVAPATFIASSAADSSAPNSLASADVDEDSEDNDADETGSNVNDGDAASNDPASNDGDPDDAGLSTGDSNDGVSNDGVSNDGDSGNEETASDGGDDADAGEDDDDPPADGAFYDSSLWSPIFGSWTLVDGTYSQSDATGFGYSSEYMGDTPEEFDVGVSMRAPFGDMNAGIIYGQPNKGTKAGSTVIDITAEGTYLRWGVYNPDSGEWTFIGGAPIDPPLVPDEFTRLDLEVRSDKTAINLNGEFLASIDSPEPGGVALVVSVANIEFENFELTGVNGGSTTESEETPEDPPAEDEADPEADEEADADQEEEIVTADGDGLEVSTGDGNGGVGNGNGGFGDGGGLTFEVIDDALNDWQLMSGSWTAADSIISQNNPDGYDQMIHFLDTPLTNYRVEVKLRAKEDSNFSGGLLFNVARTGVRADSFVFDIVDNGQSVRWATYDTNGVFSYIGGVRIDGGFDPSAWHLLAVEMTDGRAEFFIDGAYIGASQDVGTDGHVGMVTSLAAMEFSDFGVIDLDEA